MSLNFKWQVPITSSTIIDLLINLSISTFYFVHVLFSRIQNGFILERTFHNLVCLVTYDSKNFSAMFTRTNYLH